MTLRRSLNVKQSSQRTMLDITPINFSYSYVKKRKRIHKEVFYVRYKNRMAVLP
jgi:hypothetical protein